MKPSSRRLRLLLNLMLALSNIVAMPYVNLKTALVFSEITAASEGSLKIIQNATVAMSPQHAKSFARSLTGQLNAYEQQFGEIRLPEDAQQSRKKVKPAESKN